MNFRKKQISKEAAILKAADLCARSEHCISEIRDKLFRWGAPKEDIEKIIDYLIDHNYIDETRYAHAFVNDKSTFNHWGRIKIRMMLQLKRIDRHTITEAINNIDEDKYTKTLRQLTLNLSKRIDLSDKELRQKLYRQLTAKGYEPQLVIAAINQLTRQS